LALTFRDGTVDIAAISTPGVAIDIIPPSPFVGAAPSNIEAFVGVASWGTPNTMQVASGAADGYAKLGTPQVRYGDLATALAVQLSQGTAGSYRFVRVTDGTDTAASVTLPGNFGRFTARSSGSLGNSIGVAFAASTAAGSISAILQFPGKIGERYDNIFQGLASVAVTPGAGYTYVPSAMVPPPQKALSAVPAQVLPTLVTSGSPTVTAPGTTYAVNDTITLGGGVVLTVTAIGTNGAVTAVTVTTPGRLTSGAVPTGVQSSTSGSGTGATFGLNWVLGQPTIVAGGGYYSATGQALTITLQGGGATTPGSYAPTMTYGAALATAVNFGTQQRPKSGFVVFTPGTGTGTPALNTVYNLTGGTDGAAGVTPLLQAGQDGSSLSRTGAYVLRSSGMDMFTLVDCVDTSVIPAMLQLAIDETAVYSFSSANGDTIQNAINTRQTLGFDDVDLQFIVGDWPTFNDGQNGTRAVYPSLFALALAGNLSPEQGFINKRLNGVLSTNLSATGIPISNADNATAQEGGVDIIGKTAALGVDYFTFVTGRNASSNTAARGMEYPRLTNFEARSLAGPATAAIVGRLQSLNRPDDPTRKLAKALLDSFFSVQTQPQFGSGGYGIIDDFAVQCDLRNNTPASIQRGFLFAYVAVLYLNVIRVFVIQLNGSGATVLPGAAQSASTTNLSAALASLAGTNS
jgi:hypothetical protein